MPITPYTTPVQFEYKPLNLAAFAVPLAKMQEQFDLTQATISNTDFDISNLPYGTDPERAKELVALGRSKRDELATNLLQTKNYRQAAIKLNQLNKEWNRDPERLALEGEAKRFEKRKAEEIARIDNGKADQINQKDYDQWLRDEIRKYETRGGAGFKATYEDPEGTWNKFESGRGVGRLSNQEEELDKLVLEVASKLHSDSWESSLKEIGMDQETMDKHFQKSTFESLPASKVSEAVRGFLLSAPNSRFKEWGKQTAHYNFLDMYNSEDFDKYAEDIVGNALEGRGKYLDKVKGNKAEDENYQMLSEMKKTGEYDPAVVEQLYTNKHLNDLFDMSSVGNVFEYNKRGTVDTWRDVPIDGSGSGSGKDLLPTDAWVNPETNEKVSIPVYQKQMQNNATGLYAASHQLLNYGKGNVRAALYGNLSETEKQKLSSNPSAIIAKNRNLLTAYENSGSVKEFMQNAKSRGINMDLANASTIFKLFSDPSKVGVKQFKSTLEGVSKQEQAYNSAAENLQVLRENVRGTEEYKTTISNLGNSQLGLLDKDDPNSKKVYNLFNAQSYSPEALKKVGITKQNVQAQSLTFDQVAKLQGYANTYDAINKGYKFGNAPITSGAIGNVLLGNNITQYVNSLENKISGNFDANVRGKNILDTPEISADLSAMVTNLGELMQHVPANKTSWTNMPGFNEEGRPLPGTKLVAGKGTPPVMQTLGNNVNYKYYYEYIKEGEDKPTVVSVAVKPKIGTDKKHIELLNTALASVEGDDDLSRSTKATLLEAKFNSLNPNSMSMTTFDALPVGKNQKVDFESIPGEYPGQKIVFTKEWSNSYMKPIIKIYVEQEGEGGRKPINSDGTIGNGGKGFTAESPAEAKRFYAKMAGYDYQAVPK